MTATDYITDAAALAAETGEAVTSADITRSPFGGYWAGQAGGVTVFAERGRASIFLGDQFIVYDGMTMSTSAEAIRGAIRAAREDRAVTEDLCGWLEYAGWKRVTATKDWGRWRVTAVSGRDDGYAVRATVVGGHVFLPPLEHDDTVRESVLNLLERNGVPVSH